MTDVAYKSDQVLGSFFVCFFVFFFHLSWRKIKESALKNKEQCFGWVVYEEAGVANSVHAFLNVP